MDFKKKLRNFFTLTRKANAGFTLVELIVVIAVLAILAGVGSAGYAGYIKAANKGNDKVLVGNIIRAIETGTYSTMFVNEDSFTKGATTYPVGIVILTADGCQVKASSADITSTEDTPCEIKQMSVVPEGAYSVEAKKYLTALVDIYTVDESKLKTVDYCATHANINQREVPTSFNKLWGPQDKKTYTFEKDCTGIYGLCSDHVNGQVLTKENLSSYGNIVNISSTGSHAIYDALSAAFGEVDSLALTYSGWGDAEEEGHTYATLLTFTQNMIGDIKDTADSLITAVEAAKLIGKDLSSYLTEDYDDAADMMDSFSNHVVATYQEYSAWKPVWEGAASGTVVYDFGLAATRDYCYAARIAYNNAFASYCSANDIADTYVEVLKDYSHSAASGLIKVPDVTNTAAFASKDADNEDSLYAQFIAAGDTDGKVFEQCAKLFEIYKDSEACVANGKTFYNTMDTVAQTGSEAYKEGGNNAYFTYYENLMKEMSAYYDFIKGYNGSGIILLVTVDDGEVVCEVSPASANPRND